MSRATDPEKLIARMRRIEGQARGVQRMIKEGCDCEKIMIQLAAMKAAINKAAVSLVGCYMADAISEQLKKDGDIAEVLEKASKVMSKLS
ncbi:MAG TPA: metal-sensitive transcriptional regulator [Firmicutes bacterium]|nr:metal-sensitive transcriptional regulator [Bacillota bacterium]